MHGKLPIRFSGRGTVWALSLLVGASGLSGCGALRAIADYYTSAPSQAKAGASSLTLHAPQDPGSQPDPGTQPGSGPTIAPGSGDDFGHHGSWQKGGLPPVQQKTPEKPFPGNHDHDHFPPGDGQGHGHGQIPPGQTPPGPMPTQSPVSDQGGAGTWVGDSCTGDTRLCLGLRYVAFVNPRSEEAVEDRTDVEANLDDINRIWSDCGIGFQVERFEQVRPEDFELRYQTADVEELNDIRRTFNDDHRLLVVLTGPWNRNGTLGWSHANAWTNLPGEGIYGSILEGPMRRTPNMIAHELGHYLGLGHVQDESDLMNPLIGSWTRRLDPDQCAEARRVARSEWEPMLRSQQ